MENLAFRFLASLVGSPRWRGIISFVNDHHQTLAHMAVLFQYTALLEQLVEWGVDLDVQDLNGFTALHCAYLCNDWECVRILRCGGADQDLEDKLGRLPMDIYSPRKGYTRASTPSNDGTSSPARILSEGEEDWETIPRNALHPAGFDISKIATERPPLGAQTSDSDQRLIISLSSPSSDDSNDSWIKTFDESVRILNPPTNPTSSAPSQSRQEPQTSRLGQRTTACPSATSVPAEVFYLNDSTRELAKAHHLSPGTQISDLTSSLPPSEAGRPSPRVMNHRGESNSDLSSVYPPSRCTSPVSTPSPMPPETPLQSSWSHLNPCMHRPDLPAPYHYSMQQAMSEARAQRLHRPSPSPSRTGIRYDPPSHPPPSWAQMGAIAPYLDEKSQKEAMDERKIFTRSSHAPPSPSPPPVHESEYAYMKQLDVKKNKVKSKEDAIRQRETSGTPVGVEERRQNRLRAGLQSER